MRGPYERLKYDLRRIWECPSCGRTERTDGATTFRLCRCGPKPAAGAAPVLMRLVSDGALRVQPPFQMPVFPPEPPLDSPPQPASDEADRAAAEKVQPTAAPAADPPCEEPPSAELPAAGSTPE